MEEQLRQARLYDPFAVRPYPGSPTQPNHVGPWEDFTADAGIEALLRVRTVFAGRSTEFAGFLYNQLLPNTALVLGFLELEFRPNRLVRFSIPINRERSSRERADLVIGTGGQVLLWTVREMRSCVFRAVYALA